MGMTYNEIKSSYPQAVDSVEKQIRSSRSKYKHFPFRIFEWSVNKGEILCAGHDLDGHATVRIAAKKGQLFRSSELYDESGNVIPGNWSF